MPSPILARADALMQRQKTGHPAGLDDVPVLTDAIDDLDLPVLEPEPISTVPPVIETVAAPPRRFSPEERNALVRTISEGIWLQLMAELPDLINAALDEIENPPSIPRR